MSNNWIYGCIASIVGSTFSNLGVNIQKYSAIQESKKPVDEQRGYCSQPLWFLGLALVVVGAIADFVALGLAAQSIIAPIGSTTLLANLFFACFWLGEELGRNDILGTFLVIRTLYCFMFLWYSIMMIFIGLLATVGSVVSVAFGNHTDVEYTMADIEHFYGFTAFIVYLVILIVVLIVSYVAVKRLEPMRDNLILLYMKFDEAKEEKRREDMLTLKQEIDVAKQEYDPYEKWHPLLYCTLSGLFGGESVLMAKTTAVLLRATMDGDNQFTKGLTYLFLIAMVATIVIQTHYLATSLKYFDALYVVPVFQCFWITGSTVGGAIFYQELKTFDLLQSILFPLGIVITLSGVYVLSKRDMSRKEDAEVELLDELDKDESTESADAENGVAAAAASNVTSEAVQVPAVPETMKVSLRKRRSVMYSSLVVGSLDQLGSVAEEIQSPTSSSLPVSIAPGLDAFTQRSLETMKKHLPKLQVTSLNVPMPHSAGSSDLPSGGRSRTSSTVNTPSTSRAPVPNTPVSMAIGSSGAIFGSMFVDQIAPLFSDLFTLSDSSDKATVDEEAAAINARRSHRRNSAMVPMTEPHPTRNTSGSVSIAMPMSAPGPSTRLAARALSEADATSMPMRGKLEPLPAMSQIREGDRVDESDVSQPVAVHNDDVQLDEVQKAAIASGDTESYQQL